jgi:hypothetical protein
MHKKYRAAILCFPNQGVVLCWVVNGRTVKVEIFRDICIGLKAYYFQLDYSGTLVHELNSFLEAVREPKCS